MLLEAFIYSFTRMRLLLFPISLNVALSLRVKMVNALCGKVSNKNSFSPIFFLGWIILSLYTSCLPGSHTLKTSVLPGQVLFEVLCRFHMCCSNFSYNQRLFGRIYLLGTSLLQGASGPTSICIEGLDEGSFWSRSEKLHSFV